jgi:RNA polymerase sigma factor (sigma-70 family)
MIDVANLSTGGPTPYGCSPRSEHVVPNGRRLPETLPARVADADQPGISRRPEHDVVRLLRGVGDRGEDVVTLEIRVVLQNFLVGCSGTEQREPEPRSLQLAAEIVVRSWLLPLLTRVTTMEDDSALLQRYVDGRDEAAFSALVVRHADAVYSIARRCVGGDSHLAADVAQHVFLLVAQQARRLARHPALVGWLYTTTRYTATNFVRTDRRRVASERKAHVMHELEARAAETIDWDRGAPLLEEALDTLPAHDRLAILLRFIERRSFCEIGAVLALSEDAARKRVDRGLDKLRRAFERRGIFCSAAALAGTLGQAVMAAPADLAASVTSYALSGTALAGGGLSLAAVVGTAKLSVVAAGLILAFGGVGLISRQTSAPQNSNDKKLHEPTAASRTNAGDRNSRVLQNSPIAATFATTGQVPAAAQPAAALEFVPLSQLTNRGRKTPTDALSTYYWATWSLNHEELAQSIALDPAFRPKAEEVFARIPAHARERLKVRSAEEMWAFAWAMEMSERWTGLAIGEATLIGENQAQVSLELQASGQDTRNARFNRMPLQRGENGWQVWIVDGPGPNHLLDDIRKKFLRDLLGQTP